MPLDLPIYMIVGRQPVSMVRTKDGGAVLLGWDFDLGEMTTDAASWDDIVGTQPGVPVQGNAAFSEGDAVSVTKAEFDAAVRELGGTPS